MEVVQGQGGLLRTPPFGFCNFDVQTEFVHYLIFSNGQRLFFRSNDAHVLLINVEDVGREGVEGFRPIWGEISPHTPE